MISDRPCANVSRVTLVIMIWTSFFFFFPRVIKVLVDVYFFPASEHSRVWSRIFIRTVSHTDITRQRLRGECTRPVRGEWVPTARENGHRTCFLFFFFCEYESGRPRAKRRIKISVSRGRNTRLYTFNAKDGTF